MDKIILNQGRYDNISLEDYHGKIDAISKTGLDKINKSILHYLHAQKTAEPITPAKIFGSAFHCYILTPDLFTLKYAVLPEIDRRTKEGKERYADFETLNNDKDFISASDFKKIQEMGASIMKHTIASDLLYAGDAENTFIWKDMKTDILCKARPDYLRKDGIIIELKTCEDASFNSFQRAICNFRYFVQGAFFFDGITEALNKLQEGFVIIAIEKSEPYAIAVYMLDKVALDIGREYYSRNLFTYLEYLKNPEKYLGYPERIQTMYLPSYID